MSPRPAEGGSRQGQFGLEVPRPRVYGAEEVEGAGAGSVALQPAEHFRQPGRARRPGQPPHPPGRAALAARPTRCPPPASWVKAKGNTTARPATVPAGGASTTLQTRAI